MKRILIIEDDLNIAELERDYLQLNGFKADIVQDGAQGKIEKDPSNPELIETLWGTGYRLTSACREKGFIAQARLRDFTESERTESTRRRHQQPSLWVRTKSHFNRSGTTNRMNNNRNI